MTNVFIRRPYPLIILSTNPIGFASIKDCYSTNIDFQKIWSSLHNIPSFPIIDYTIIDGYLIKGGCIYIPRDSLWEFII